MTSEQKKKILSESNALLFPSLIEGFGLVMLEAFQQNRPVITSDIPPMSDIIQNNQTGLVVDPHDENKWADSIIALIKNPEISNKMGKQGNQTLQAKYNQNIFYDKLIKMYNDIALN